MNRYLIWKGATETTRSERAKKKQHQQKPSKRCCSSSPLLGVCSPPVFCFSFHYWRLLIIVWRGRKKKGKIPRLLFPPVWRVVLVLVLFLPLPLLLLLPFTLPSFRPFCATFRHAHRPEPLPLTVTDFFSFWVPLEVDAFLFGSTGFRVTSSCIDDNR